MSLLEKSSSIELSRRTQPFYAKRSTYNLGAQVQIEVDLQREFLDFENSRLVFEVVWGASTDALSNDWVASQCIKNLRVKTLAGQMIGHEIREYRAYCQMYKELAGNSDANDSYLTVMEGANEQALADAGTTIQYAHKFMAHIFTIKEYYPAHFHQGIMIEFDLPANINELQHEATASGDALSTAVTFENCKYVADLVQLKPEIENEMVKMMESQRLFADYTEVLTQENNLAAQSGLQAFDIVGIDGRVKSIFSYSVQDDARNSDEEAFFANWGRNNMTGYRYKLGANYLNYETIQCGEAVTESKRAEQIFELMKALDMHDTKSLSHKAGDSALLEALHTGPLNTTRFAVGVKVDKAQKNTNSVISSMVDKDRNNVRAELTFAATPTVGTIYTHVVLDKRIQILSGSIVRNVRS